VTPRVIARGIERFLTGVKWTFSDQWDFEPRPFYDMDDLAAMDSDEADCVIQLGLFGRLVYG
jgi:hypothetical protein